MATAAAKWLNKGLMSRTIAMHMRYNSWYISLPSSAKQESEMTKFVLSGEHETRRLIFLNFHFGFIDVSWIQFRDSFDRDKQSKRLKGTARFLGKL